MSPEKEKVTVMILYVDLKCSCCYKKVRKLLCKFPQIRDQVFDEDKNKVTITVVCCDPERLRDKLCCKGGKSIQSIEIVEPKPKPEPEKTKPSPAPVSKPDPPKVDPPPTKKPDPVPVPMPAPILKKPDPAPQPQPVKKPDPKPQPVPVKMPDPKPQPQPQPVKMPDPKPQPQPVPVKMPEPKPQPKPEPVKMPDPIPVPIPQPQPEPMYPYCPPVAVCCQECYEGRDGGPCNFGYGGYGRPVPAPCYDGYGYPYRPPCYVSRCDYFSEENPQGCSIM
ncbi:hypothetical protein QVD17_36341 [Tagetes erecta]|uniref:Uncharacterized protein n=1 Tax=Tagetes erecta TaxID=13708 RepID=A0AAD8JW74_TARER|nr:hypothetical protein QVD17_36341 [Tagetes erecta]